MLRQHSFTNLTLIFSHQRLGPGGGRTIGIHQASQPIVASFDDDSYPLDVDYFDRLLTLFKRFPNAAVIAAAIYHPHEAIAPALPQASWTSDFVGCGCAYRRQAFLETEGYVPLACAYGMEEVDLALQCRHLGWGILQSNQLRVFHNTTLTHHHTPQVTAASLSNQLLLMYLRYPLGAWWIGVGQVINRLRWLLRHGRSPGIFLGLFQSVPLIWQYRNRRRPVSRCSVRSHLSLRRHPITAEF